jgi:glyceraldehyde 3-phosphate dehydrogenase
MHETKKIRIGINGFGRIGRAAFKVALEKKNIEIVAINDLVPSETLAHLLRYDSVYGAYQKKVEAHADSLEVEGLSIKVLSEKEPQKLPWKKFGIDVAIESTGLFVKHEDAEKHLKAGAKRVLISAPAKDEKVSTHVISVNTSDAIKSEIVSNASCTTNCIAPVTSIINTEYGIEHGMITTIHSYTASQNLVDGPHKDLRRARAAAYNIVPTSTGAAIATTKTMPELKDKFDAVALRVPTICGSLSDFTFVLKKKTSVSHVNDLFREKVAQPPYHGVVDVTSEPLVSSDIIGNPHSAIVDLEFTRVVDGTMLKVLAWYDNEWGYANRLVEMVEQLNI